MSINHLAKVKLLLNFQFPEKAGIRQEHMKKLFLFKFNAKFIEKY